MIIKISGAEGCHAWWWSRRPLLQQQVVEPYILKTIKVKSFKFKLARCKLKMQQTACIAAAIKCARKWATPRHWWLSVGAAVEPSTRVLPPQSFVTRSSGGRFARSLTAAQYRWRSLVNNEFHRLNGTLWLAASRKLQYYANQGCKTCANCRISYKFITVVIVFSCNF